MIDCSGLGALVGRETPESRISTFGNFGPCSKWLYNLAKTNLCLALKLFGAFIIMMHTGYIID